MNKLRLGRKPAAEERGTAAVAFGRVPRLAVWAWSFVGIAIAAAIIVIGLSAVSEVVLPVVFAAVLAIIFKPLVLWLVRHRFQSGLAAAVVVTLLLLLMAGIAVATARGVAGQMGDISAAASAALDNAAQQADVMGVSRASLEELRAAVREAAPIVATGVLSGLVSGLSTLAAIAGGVVLGSIVMYYFLKDGSALRRSFVSQFDVGHRNEVDGFIGDACRILRDYGRGRTAMSVLVALVIGAAALLLGLPLIFTIVIVNFIGGYIPYIGAFIGGSLAVIIALGEGGLMPALIMLVVLLASNLVLENFIQPKLMGNTLQVHPMAVLIVTVLGGVMAGIVGLLLAVPAYTIAASGLRRLRKTTD